MRFIVPLLLIGISIAGFFILITPKYEEVVVLKAQVAAYDKALNNSKSLEDERDKLIKKSNDISKVNKEKIEKMLPDSIDNIRLILEIEELASVYGMYLKDVRYDDEKKAEEGKPEVVQAGAIDENINEDYGVWDLEFTTEGSYANFINFTRDIEKNLRLVDISSVQFSSLSAPASKSATVSTTDNYIYTFKIKTYWLKN
jgi:hypothetical protein